MAEVGLQLTTEATDITRTDVIDIRQLCLTGIRSGSLPPFVPPAFRDDVTKIEDVREGMKLEGVVTNVTAFGAFVDIGVHQDGLIHLSELSDHYVSDPASVVKAGDRLAVTVIGVDVARGRISLSAKSKPVVGAGGGVGGGGQSRAPRPRQTSFGGGSGFTCNPFANL